MNVEKRHLELARKITKDVETIKEHLEVILNESLVQERSEEEQNFFTQWHNWLVPTLTAQEQAKGEIIAAYQQAYPNGESIEEEVKPKKKKAQKGE